VSIAMATLLAACGDVPPDKPLDPLPPMCTDVAPPITVKVVRVSIDAAGQTTPANCVVRSRQEVVWEGPSASQLFMLRFEASPGGAAPNWVRGAAGSFRMADASREFPSSLEGGRQRVRIRMKDVSVAEDIPYCVALEVTCVDPGIRIQPR